MKIDFLISHEEIDTLKKYESISNSTVIVIDALRATSVMVTALMNGAKRIYPFRTIEESFGFKDKNLDLDFLLGGERKGLKIEGFNLSNSPLEYTKEKVYGRNVIMSTSNGTQCLEKVVEGKTVLIASMLNFTACAKKALEIGDDILIVNSGTSGRLSLDDFAVGGAIVSVIEKTKEVYLSDTARLALMSYEKIGAQNLFKDAYHYRYLKSIGYDKDLMYCTLEDITDIVPQFRNGYIEVEKEK